MSDEIDDFEALKESALDKIQEFMNVAYDDQFSSLFTLSEIDELQTLADEAMKLFQILSDRSPSFSIEDDEDGN
ncbi:hypothetical protein [Merismopedia glauca]|uniref:Uncharacterized protein n=1 Tax=Merismopedia glauca CCAP 1448/3 TaxID=1296344 RepID=A0A2T1C2D3_9CYAN|nr:hypothetical protein [Merismopedia glauca]PSB02364.1 hypothetical protein C7B64_13590 [Merismopedia glauca CCAP 1448/3]